MNDGSVTTSKVQSWVVETPIPGTTIFAPGELENTDLPFDIITLVDPYQNPVQFDCMKSVVAPAIPVGYARPDKQVDIFSKSIDVVLVLQ